MKKKLKFFTLAFLINIMTSTLTIKALTPSYQESKVETVNDLGYGLVHRHILGLSSSENSSTLVPQNIHLLEKSSLNQKVELIPWGGFTGPSSYPHRYDGMNLVDMAKDFEAKNPSYQVLAGVNSVFFSMPTGSEQDYMPIDAFGINGNIYKTSTVTTVMGFDNLGNRIVGESTNLKKLELSIYNENNQIINEININRLNALPNSNETTVYFDNTTLSINDETISIYQISNPEVIKIGSADYYGLGVISAMPKSISLSNAKRSFIILTKNEKVKELLNLNVKVRIQSKFTNNLQNAVHIQGYHGNYLKDNQVLATYEEMGKTSSIYTDRNPRTAIGFKADGSVLIATVDGRKEGNSGMNLKELGYFMKHYGCVDGYNFDGGGSTTMLVRESNGFKIVNDYSDPSPRKVVSGLFFVVNKAGYVHPTLQTLTKDEAKIKVDYVNVLNQNYKVKAIYLGQEFEVINNILTLPYLNSINYVNFKIEYFDQENKVYYDKQPFIFQGLKRAPTISKIEVKNITGEEASITYQVQDDDASLLKVEVIMNDLTYLGSNTKTLVSSLKGDYDYTFNLKVTYNDGQENKEFISSPINFKTDKRLINESDIETHFEQVSLSDKVNIYVNVRESGIPYQKIFVNFNDQKFEVVDGKVTLSSLSYGQTYRYSVSYIYLENGVEIEKELDITKRFNLTYEPQLIDSSSLIDSSNNNQYPKPFYLKIEVIISSISFLVITLIGLFWITKRKSS